MTLPESLYALIKAAVYDRGEAPSEEWRSGGPSPAVVIALARVAKAARESLEFWRASGPLTADDVQENVESALRSLAAALGSEP